jgi:hypothetical protein
MLTRTLSENPSCTNLRVVEGIKLWNTSLNPIGDQSSVTFSYGILIQPLSRTEQCLKQRSQVLEPLDV